MKSSVTNLKIFQIFEIRSESYFPDYKNHTQPKKRKEKKSPNYHDIMLWLVNSFHCQIWKLMGNRIKKSTFYFNQFIKISIEIF